MQSIDDALEAIFREQLLLELMIDAGGATAAVSDALAGKQIHADIPLPPLHQGTVESHQDGLKARIDRQLDACLAMFENLGGKLLQLGRRPLRIEFDVDEPAVPLDAKAERWLEHVQWTYADMEQAANRMRVCIEIAEHRARELRIVDDLEP